MRTLQRTLLRTQLSRLSPRARGTLHGCCLTSYGESMELQGLLAVARSHALDASLSRSMPPRLRTWMAHLSQILSEALTLSQNVSGVTGELESILQDARP